MTIKTANFVISNSDYKLCPAPNIPEYAFIGRSNVGKSSIINAIVSQKKLAKISGKPGKTKLINHFIINNQWYLVDLPGFGYTKTSKSERKRFQKMTSEYLLNKYPTTMKEKPYKNAPATGSSLKKLTILVP